MPITLAFPSKALIQRFLERESQLDFSYPEVGQSLTSRLPQYDNDHTQLTIGSGEATWELAKLALNNWQHFPEPWTRIHAAPAAPAVGDNVAVLFRIFGLWFTNSARIVYTFDEPHRYGFAYGTLPGHVEQGEECFWIERDAAGQISYHIKAFSKPRFWLARLGYPIARLFQRRFVRQSMAKMAAIATL